MDVIVPMLFSFWMCVIYVIFSIVMIAIWVCIGIMGGPAVRLKRPKIPLPPKLPDIPSPVPLQAPERPLEA
jgi:amino acid transporter